MNNWNTPARIKYWESLKGIKNELAPNWKGGKAGKGAVHKWLDVNYGKPKICESSQCLGKSKTFDWAKKTGAKYIKSRDAFLRLCRSCHKKYDWKPEYRLKAIKNLYWFTKKFRIRHSTNKQFNENYAK